MARRKRTRRPNAISVLLRLTKSLTGDSGLEDSLRHVTDAALELVPADHASIRLLDATRTSLLSGGRSGAGAAERPLEFRRSEGLLGWVVEHRQAVHAHDVLGDPRFVVHEGQGFKIRSIIAEPLWAAGDVIGVLSVSSAGRAVFSDQDRLLVRLLANCSVSPIEKARLRRLAIVDDLTLAFNHRYLLPRMHEEMERARRTGSPLSFLLMDLDHFKRVNDLHGHQVGDAVLRQFADRVRENVRRIDVLVRRGGEEFVLLMPSTAMREARAIAERIQRSLATTAIEVGGASIVQTVSIGLATWDGVEEPETLERRADVAMYEAKRRGRNRVEESIPAPAASSSPKPARTTSPRKSRGGRAGRARPRSPPS
jgi:two-component system cell cycle response regulator